MITPTWRESLAGVIAGSFFMYIAMYVVIPASTQPLKMTVFVPLSLISCTLTLAVTQILANTRRKKISS